MPLEAVEVNKGTVVNVVSVVVEASKCSLANSLKTTSYIIIMLNSLKTILPNMVQVGTGLWNGKVDSC